jgi:hypothetical protein
MFRIVAIKRHDEVIRFEVTALSASDVDDIYALYALTRSTTPHGFLALRTKHDFHNIFTNPQDSIGTGIRHQGQLIAYSICHRLTRNPYPISPVLSLIDATTSRVYHGDGTVVDPAFQGRTLARRISRLRRQQIRERHIDHLFGLIAVDNIVSIGNAMLAGALLSGFLRDETALNYIAYAGRFCDKLRTDAASVTVGLKNQEQQRRLFTEGKVACNLIQSSSLGPSASMTGGERLLAFVPWTVRDLKESLGPDEF